MKGRVQEIIEDKRVKRKFMKPYEGRPATTKPSYRPKPLKAYTPVPPKPYKPAPLKDYTPVPIKPYIPEPLKRHKRKSTKPPPGPTSKEKCPYCDGDIVLKTDGRVMQCGHCKGKVQYVGD